MFVKVCDPVKVVTVESIASVTVVPEALESNPVPPAIVSDSEPKATSIDPEPVAISKLAHALFQLHNFMLIPRNEIGVGSRTNYASFIGTISRQQTTSMGITGHFCGVD